MGKPHIEVYERFQRKYSQFNQKMGKQQFLVPYLMSSHPGSTLQDAVALAEYLNRMGRQPEQVQDFYPVPGTLSTCMYYTGIDPRTMEPVYVARSPPMRRPSSVRCSSGSGRRCTPWCWRPCAKAGRTDLIGYTPRLSDPAQARPGPPWGAGAGGEAPCPGCRGREGTAKRKQKGGRPIKVGTPALPAVREKAQAIHPSAPERRAPQMRRERDETPDTTAAP